MSAHCTTPHRCPGPRVRCPRCRWQVCPAWLDEGACVPCLLAVRAVWRPDAERYAWGRLELLPSVEALLT